ncbi:MAG: 7-carboxy-7-deazaguanine synthase QueE [Candidatus Gastranaerophilales bacterium]|nr:7-carboxy-7-deazaguanine synthase QueE [Candidatus Gastranaerophilales bacterium]
MENDSKTKIKEIFTSIQGEGPYLGYKQLFIRFSRCNLHCNYCDTEFLADFETNKYSPLELAKKIKKDEIDSIHSISLTGGEPLIENQFLKEFLPLTNKKIYLETNGTLTEELKSVIKFIDYVSMDIKLNSAGGNGNLFDKHKDFIKICKDNKKEIFVKIVFDNNITDKEIKLSAELAKNADIELILQPMMAGKTLVVSSDKIIEVYDKFNNHYKKVRLIPQTHKFLDIE